MKFSIIIPAYNAEKYLLDCVSSVLKQTINDYEIIIINDGSTDQTNIICESLLERNNNIKIINQENRGLSEARNVGIKYANGEYLLFLDSDDFLYGDDALLLLQEKCLCEPDLIIFLPIEFDENCTTILKQHNISGIATECILDKNTLINELYSGNEILITMAQTKLIKREFLIANNLLFISGIYHEDDEWIARLVLSIPKTLIFNKSIYGYRHRSGSIINNSDISKTQKKIIDRIFVASQMLKNINEQSSEYFILYAIRYFLSAVSIIKLLPKTYRNPCKEKIKECDNIFDAMRFTKNKRMKFLSFLKRVFGVNFVIKIIS